MHASSISSKSLQANNFWLKVPALLTVGKISLVLSSRCSLAVYLSPIRPKILDLSPAPGRSGRASWKNLFITIGSPFRMVKSNTKKKNTEPVNCWFYFEFYWNWFWNNSWGFKNRSQINATAQKNLKNRTMENKWNITSCFTKSKQIEETQLKAHHSSWGFVNVPCGYTFQNLMWIPTQFQGERWHMLNSTMKHCMCCISNTLLACL